MIAAQTFPSDQGAAARLSGSSGTSIGGRLDRWRLALPAIADRPVLGIGPGLYRQATSPHDTVAAARAFGADRLYQDAAQRRGAVRGDDRHPRPRAARRLAGARHGGCPGRAGVVRRVRGLSLFVEPQFIGLTPVLALTLGAAAPRATPPATPVIRGLVVAGLVVGVAAGGLLLRGDVAFDGAGRDRRSAIAHRAERLLPMWPEPATFTAARRRAGRRRVPGAGRGRRDRVAVHARRLAVRRDPSAAPAHLLVADLELDRGHPRAAAARASRAALRWNPQSTIAFDGLARLAAERHDRAGVARWCGRYRAVVRAGAVPVRSGLTVSASVAATPPWRAGPAPRPRRCRPRR